MVIPDFLFEYNTRRRKKYIGLETKVTYERDASMGITQLRHPARQLFNHYAHTDMTSEFQIWLSTCVVNNDTEGSIETIKFSAEQSKILALRCVLYDIATSDKVAISKTAPNALPTNQRQWEAFRRKQLQTALKMAEKVITGGGIIAKLKSILPTDRNPDFEEIEWFKQLRPLPTNGEIYVDGNNTGLSPLRLALKDAYPPTTRDTGQAQAFKDHRHPFSTQL